MKWLINKYKCNKKNVIFFIIGNFIAVTFISIGISSIDQMKFLSGEKNDGLPESTRVLGISLQEKINVSEIEKLVKKFPKEGYYKIVNQSIYIDGYDKRIGSPIHIIFDDIKEEDLKILKGNNGAVMVGKRLENNIDENGQISVYGEKLKVDGIIGGKQEASKWDKRLILNINRIPERNKKSLESGNFQLYVESENRDINNIVEEINGIIQKEYKNALIETKLIQTEEMHMSEYKEYSKETMGKIFIIYIISIINLIFITTRWIYGLRNEIGVMKCVGLKDITIIKRIFLEYILVVGISLILSLIFQQILYLIIGSFDIVYFKVSLNNLFLGGIVSIITSIVVLLNPLRKIIYQSPIKLLRR